MNNFLSNIQEQFLELKNLHPGNTELQEIKQKALKLFVEKGLPHKKLERWRHKAIDSLVVPENTPFLPYLIQQQPTPYRPVEEFFKCNIHDIGTEKFVFLNGWYHSKQPLETLENGVIVGSILAALQTYPELVTPHFAKIDLSKEDGMIALNEALFTDGIFIYVPDNVVVEKSIQIISVIDTLSKLFVQHRHLIVLGKNSSLSLVHCDDSIKEEHSFINNVMEVNLAENAQLHYYKMENKDAQTILVNNTFVQQSKDSRFISNMITFNSGYVRNGIQVQLNECGADAKLYGLYLVDKKQYVDNQVNVFHNAPQCTSNQIYKGIADDEAGANFSGHIVVQKDAQQTLAYQVNRNISLTDDAKITTHPFLEIYADDVKCSHGATVGQLDENAMFYLRSRGICQRNARMLLMYAFANEVANFVLIDKLREKLNDMIKKRLSGELHICDQCLLHCSDEKNFTFEIDEAQLRR